MAAAEKPARPQPLRELLGDLLGADEDDHPLEVLDLEDAGERVDLLRVGHHEVALPGVGRGGGLVLDGDLGGVGEVLLRDPPDLRRHGGREQRDVLVVRRPREDRLDVLREAHLQHLVGLVEHQEAQLGQVEGALLEVVHDASGGADHDVHAAAQRRELDAVPLAAVDRQHVQARQVRGVALEGLRDLERELAGGRQHQGLRRLLPHVDLGEDRHRERGGLAGAGLRQPDDVAALEQRRDGGGLDGRGRLVADVGQRPEHPLVDAEVGEGHGGFGSCVGGGVRAPPKGSAVGDRVPLIRRDVLRRHTPSEACVYGDVARVAVALKSSELL